MSEIPGRPSPGGAAENAAAAAHAPVGHEQEHEQTGVQLGPLDVPAWAAGFLGVLLGLAILAALFLAGRPA